MRLAIAALAALFPTVLFAQQPGKYTATIDGMTSFAEIRKNHIYVSRSIVSAGGGLSYRKYPATVKGCSFSFRAEGVYFNLCANGQIIDSNGRKRGFYRKE